MSRLFKKLKAGFEEAVAYEQGKIHLRCCSIKVPDSLIGQQLNQIPEHESWIYDKAKKHIVEHIKEGLLSRATIKRGSFVKYAKQCKEKYAK